MADPERIPAPSPPAPAAGDGLRPRPAASRRLSGSRYQDRNDPAGAEYIGSEIRLLADGSRTRPSGPEAVPAAASQPAAAGRGEASRPAGLPGGWDYNPAYLDMDLKRMEQQAAEASRRRQELADSELAARARLEQAADPQQQRRLDEVRGQLDEAGRELADLNRRIGTLREELGQICRRLENSGGRAGDSDLTIRAA